MNSLPRFPTLAACLAALALAAAAGVQAQPGSMPGGPGCDMHGGGGRMAMHGGGHKAHHGAGMHGGGMHGGGMAAGPRGQRMLDQVGASSEQKAKIQEIWRSAQADLEKTHSAQQGLHQQMAKLMAAPQLDAQAAEALRQQLAAGHEAASKRMLQARLDSAAVLSAEQRQKWAEHMAQRPERGERRHPGAAGRPQS